jgi:hypothetical protein
MRARIRREQIRGQERGQGRTILKDRYKEKKEDRGERRDLAPPFQHSTFNIKVDGFSVIF